MSEHQRVEERLAGRIKRPVQAEVTAHLPVAALLTVQVTVDPTHKQIQTGPDSSEDTRLSVNLRVLARIVWFLCFCVCGVFAKSARSGGFILSLDDSRFRLRR